MNEAVRNEAICTGCRHVASFHTAQLMLVGVVVECLHTDCECRYLS